MWFVDKGHRSAEDVCYSTQRLKEDCSSWQYQKSGFQLSPSRLLRCLMPRRWFLRIRRYFYCDFIALFYSTTGNTSLSDYENVTKRWQNRIDRGNTHKHTHANPHTRSHLYKLAKLVARFWAEQWTKHPIMYQFTEAQKTSPPTSYICQLNL